MTTEHLDLDAIEQRANAATPGPWCTDSWEIYQGAEYEPGISFWIGETCRGTGSPEQDRADAAFVAAARTDVPALVAEIRRLRAERDEFCNRVDTLTAVAKGNKRHVQEMFLELQKAQAALEQIRHLHKDSPMGPCPVCIDADAAAAGGDGLVPYPCPTGRLAGAQDCEPPHVRAAAPTA